MHIYGTNGVCLALLLMFGLGAAQQGFSQPAQDYSVGQLLQPCMEGDNDSREQGYVLELQCEQYIRGFLDAYILFAQDGDGKKVCLPPQNRADEVRWAFMRWAHEHYDQRQMPAAEGLATVLATMFPCS